MPSKEAILNRLDLRDYYSQHVPSLKGEPQASGKCPFHDDQRASFSVNLDNGLWKCHAGCGSGDIFDFHMKLHGVDFKTALRELAREAGVTDVQVEGRIVETYDYLDEKGNLLYQVCRFDPKDFRPRRKGPDGRWIYDLRGVRRVPYNLPELIKARGIVIVEGEKDVENLKKLKWAEGWAVTTTLGGAQGWKPEYADFFHGKSVIIIPDNDQPGLHYAETVAQSLYKKASAIRILRLPGLGEVKDKRGFDISDWLALRRREGRSNYEIKTELVKLIKRAPKWEPKTDNAPEKPSGLVVLDTVTPEPVSWLWDGYIPLGKLTVIDGDPGVGKSTATLDLAARVSRGASMPDGSPGVLGGAVLLTLEDGLADTIVPRLKAIDADLRRIIALQAVHDENGKPRFPTVEDVEAIRQACEKVQAKVVIIDPLTAHLSGRINSWRDQDIRAALTPLAKMAEETGVAVIVVRHLNKNSGGQAIYRGGGSIGIIGAARCAYLVAKDPEDENKRVFAPIKNNLAPMPPSLSFGVEDCNGVARIRWLGESSHGADALLVIPASAEERSALDEAKDFLRDILSAGPVEARIVQREARETGIKDATLRRAKKALGIVVQKEGYQGAWSWAFPPKDAHESPKMFIKNNEHLWGEMSTFERNEGSGGGGDNLREVTI